MVWFKTQAEVSKYYGKNPNDRSYISRRIIKWEVIKKDWWYEILEWDTTRVRELEEEVKKLKSELNECSVTTTYTQSDMDYVQWILDWLEVEVSELQNIILEIYKSSFKTTSWQEFKRKFWITFTVPWEEE